MSPSIVNDVYKYTKGIRATRKIDAQRPVPPFSYHILPTGMLQELFTLDQCIVGVMHTLILNLRKHLLLTAVAALSEKKMNGQNSLIQQTFC